MAENKTKTIVEEPPCRDLFLFEDIGEDSVKNIAKSIMEINNFDYKYCVKHKPIRLFLCTCGGEVYPAFALYDIIKESHTPVDIYVAGEALSSGLLILQAARTRYMYKNALLMYHQVKSYRISGNSSSIDNEATRLRLDQNRWENIITERTKVTKEQLQQMNETDWYMDCDQALTNGFIDKIITKGDI